MDCIRVKKILAENFDENLFDKLPDTLFEHLRQCEKCRQYYDQLQSLDQKIGTLSMDFLPKDTIDKVLKSIHSPVHLTIYKDKIFKKLAAAAVLILILGTWIFSLFHPSSTAPKIKTEVYLHSAQIDQRPANTIIFKPRENKNRTIIWMY